MKKYLLFDLDGTLTDSEEGIINSIQYALGAMGMQEPDRSKLRHFIGPPLAESFRTTFFMSKEKAELAVSLYRKYYSKKGIFECKVYDDIPKMLEVLHKTGRTLAVAGASARTRPPWFDTMIASAPASTALQAALPVMIPLTAKGFMV